MLTNTAIAYVAIILAVIIFGTNFIPVKKIATGDGLFFQLIVCVHIWLVGLLICFFRNTYVLHPLPMLGGCLWATGNLCKVPIIKTVGLGIGQVVWAGTNCLFGWSIARFGLFGGESQIPSNVWLNYIGVGLTTLSLIIFSAVDSHGKTEHSIQGRIPGSDEDDVASEKLISDPDFTDKMSQTLKKSFGLILSLFSGLFYGANFFPITLAVQKGWVDNHLDATFSHFTGILGTHLIYFIIYSVYTHNSPQLFNRAVLPGACTGLTWGVAFFCWLYANRVLGEHVTFPILATAPSVLGCVIGIYFFKEVTNTRHIMLAAIGSLVCTVGVLFTAFSK